MGLATGGPPLWGDLLLNRAMRCQKMTHRMQGAGAPHSQRRSRFALDPLHVLGPGNRVGKLLHRGLLS